MSQSIEIIVEGMDCNNCALGLKKNLQKEGFQNADVIFASKTVNFVIEGIEEFVGVTIVSNKAEEIREMIIYKMGKGVTIYKGESGFECKRKVDVIYTVITRLEINKLNTEIEKIDENAFIVMNILKDIKGGMIKKRLYSKIHKLKK